MSDAATLAQHRAAWQARAGEAALRPLASWVATRVFLVLEKPV
jgi:hypothetical protein